MKTFKEFLMEAEDITEVPPEEDEILYPGGVYVSVKVAEESQIFIEKYMEEYLPLSENIAVEELHSTIIYSKKKQKEEVFTKEYTAIGTFIKFSKFGDDNNVLVVEIDSPMLHDRYNDLTEEYRFISDYEEYKPHFTLSYNAKDIDINSLPPIDFAVYFENETSEALDEEKYSDKDEESYSDTMVGKAMSKKEEEDKKEDSKEETEDKDKKDEK